MITIDPREGSIELQPLLASMNVPTQVQTLSFGDFAFEGKGPKGPCYVGIERKRTRDILSCIHSGRFSGHQLPGMLALYDFPWLIIEGIYQSNPETGLLEEPYRGGWRTVRVGTTEFMHRQLENFLTTLELRAIRWRHTSSPRDTCQSILNLYHYFVDKEWSGHHAHLHFHNAPDPTGIVTMPSLIRRVAKEFNGIGWERSKAVANRFHSVLDMVNAPVSEWAKLPGIGTGIANKVVKEVRGEGHAES